LENVFKRREIKFILNREQYTAVKKSFATRMVADEYANYLVQNVYFDTDNWSVIRESIEKPLYKEKLRLRCYGIPRRDTFMFLELKKKFDGIVYKRRIAFPMEEIFENSKNLHRIIAQDSSQIGRELAFYLETHPVYERVYIAYQRQAFFDGNDLRVTFDTDTHFRLHSLGYENPRDGNLLIPPDSAIMEIKTGSGVPLWLTEVLSGKKIYPTTFSKYGTGYIKYIYGGV